MGRAQESMSVEVDGGRLHAARWAADGPVVLCAHGITANHRTFGLLADALADHCLIAPDLRGRGRSMDVSGPFGMAAHADDLVRVLDAAGAERAVVVGHSMGGFVAAVLAHRHPGRVDRIVFVDGGIPLDIGPLAGLPVEQLTRAIIGPALDRLKMTFESEQAYLHFWRGHPALSADWNDTMQDVYRYDLTGSPPNLRPAVAEQAVLADAADQLTRPDTATAVAQLRHRAVLLWAPAGLMGAEPGLYTAERVAEWESSLPALRSRLVAGVNHYTILLTERGANAVADAVRRPVA